MEIVKRYHPKPPTPRVSERRALLESGYDDGNGVDLSRQMGDEDEED